MRDTLLAASDPSLIPRPVWADAYTATSARHQGNVQPAQNAFKKGKQHILSTSNSSRGEARENVSFGHMASPEMTPLESAILDGVTSSRETVMLQEQLAILRQRIHRYQTQSDSLLPMLPSGKEQSPPQQPSIRYGVP